MFIEITWKNSNGEDLKALVPSDKVQNFVNQFLERDVKPVLVMPVNDDVHIVPDSSGNTLTITQS